MATITRGDFARGLLQEMGYPVLTGQALVDALVAEGITTKTTVLDFLGSNPITREEAAAMTARAMGLPNASGTAFADVGTTFGAGSIYALYNAGIVKGFGDGTFQPTAFLDVAHAPNFFSGLASSLAPAKAPDPGFAKTIVPPPLVTPPTQTLTPTVPLPGTPTAVAPPEQLTSDAYGWVSSTLATWGLSGSEIEGIIRQLVQGQVSPEGALIAVYETNTFKQLFPEYWAIKDAGGVVQSPGNILEYRETIYQLANQYGLPAGMINSNLFVNLMTATGGGISPVEFETRLVEGYDLVMQSPIEVREKMAEYFGVAGDANLAAYFVDPDAALPELIKQAQAALIGGVGAALDFDLTLDRADRVADFGYSQSAIYERFASLDQMRSLFQETMGETVDLTAEEEGLNAVFGLEGNAFQILEARRASRINRFRGGGGAAATNEGLIGLSTAE